MSIRRKYSAQSSEAVLTLRQAQVLEHVAKRLTLKQIAGELSISESRVNHLIKELKDTLGANSLPELAEAYRNLADPQAKEPCRESAWGISGLSDELENGQLLQPNGLGSVVGFHDALSYRLNAPWEETVEPVVVPGVLRGANAKLVRSAFIVGIAFGIFVLVLVGLGVAQGLSNVLAG